MLISISLTKHALQNILVLAVAPKWWVKIGDFGISKRIEFSAARTRIGTESYLAPEVKGIYTMDSDDEETDEFSLAVDIWSIGAIAYRIATGQEAFAAQRSLHKYVVRGDPFPFATTLELAVSNFIEKTMAPSPQKRLNVYQAYNHPWIRDVSSANELNLDSTTTDKIQIPSPQIIEDATISGPEASFNMDASEPQSPTKYMGWTTKAQSTGSYADETTDIAPDISLTHPTETTYNEYVGHVMSKAYDLPGSPCAWSEDRQRFFVPRSKTALDIWTMRVKLGSFEYHKTQEIECDAENSKIAFSKDGAHIAIQDGLYLRIWDEGSDGQFTLCETLKPEKPIFEMTWSFYGAHLIILGEYIDEGTMESGGGRLFEPKQRLPWQLVEGYTYSRELGQLGGFRLGRKFYLGHPESIIVGRDESIILKCLLPRFQVWKSGSSGEGFRHIQEFNANGLSVPPAFSFSGNYLILSTNLWDKIWKLNAEGTRFQSIKFLGSPIDGEVELSPDGRTVIIYPKLGETSTKDIQVWSRIIGGEFELVQTTESYYPVEKIQFSWDDQLMYCTTRSGFEIWRISNNGRCIPIYRQELENSSHGESYFRLVGKGNWNLIAYGDGYGSQIFSWSDVLSQTSFLDERT